MHELYDVKCGHGSLAQISTIGEFWMILDGSRALRSANFNKCVDQDLSSISINHAVWERTCTHGCARIIACINFLSEIQLETKRGSPPTIQNCSTFHFHAPSQILASKKIQQPAIPKPGAPTIPSRAQSMKSPWLADVITLRHMGHCLSCWQRWQSRHTT